MKRGGHKGVNMILAAPVTAGFLFLELYLAAFLFFVLAVKWSSLPDVDVHLDDYPKFTYSQAEGTHKLYVPVYRLSIRLNNAIHRVSRGRFLDRIGPRTYRKVTHRGMTHTIWFGITVGLFVTGLVVFGVFIAAVGLWYGTTAYDPTLDFIAQTIEIPEFDPRLLLGEPQILAAFPAIFLAGVFGTVFHTVGDLVTPSGASLLSPHRSYTINRIRFDNEFGNRVSFSFGLVISAYLIIGSVAIRLIPELEATYVAMFLGGLAVLYLSWLICWLYLSRTVIGSGIVWIYDFFFSA